MWNTGTSPTPFRTFSNLLISPQDSRLLNLTQMLRPLISISLLLIAACDSTPTQWGYDGSIGPATWGELDSSFSTCATGRSQSPIDIVTADLVAEDMPELVCDYGTVAVNIVNNSHAIELTVPEGSMLQVGGREYQLQQFHFHGPSEHTIDGEHAAMEMHMVHKDAEGNLAVISALIDEGAENGALASAWQHLPSAINQPLTPAGATVDIAAVLPEDRSYLSYSGSFTTPPCTEGVAWYMFRQRIQLSPEQIAAFRGVMPPNNRPVQPTNGRIIRTTR